MPPVPIGDGPGAFRMSGVYRHEEGRPHCRKTQFIAVIILGQAVRAVSVKRYVQHENEHVHRKHSGLQIRQASRYEIIGAIFLVAASEPDDRFVPDGGPVLD